MKTKSSHIYGWDEEPVDERPSEFSSSTGYNSVLSGNDPGAAARRRRTRERTAWRGMLIFCVALLGAGGVAIVKLVPLLHL